MKKILFTALTALVICFGCKDDEEINNGTFTITRDGAESKVREISATLTIRDEQASQSDHANHALRIGGLIGVDSINIMVSNWGFQQPPDNAVILKDYYNIFHDTSLAVGEKTETCMRSASNQFTCEAAIVSYFKNEKMFYSFSIEEEDVVILHLTKCDGQRVSGSFNLSLQNPYNFDEQVAVSGIFTDLKYEVRNR